MRLCVVILVLLYIFTSCEKWKYGYPDTQFRKQFVGTYQIDSVVMRTAIIDSVSGVHDSNYTVLPLLNDYLEILATEDQIEKNVTCTGKFLDSVFRYEVQGFNDKGSERLGFTYCNVCQYSVVFSFYFVGSNHIVLHNGKQLVFERRFNINDKDFFTRIHLTKL